MAKIYESFGLKKAPTTFYSPSNNSQSFSKKERHISVEDNMDDADKVATDLAHFQQKENLQYSPITDASMQSFESYAAADPQCYEGAEEMLERDFQNFCDAEGVSVNNLENVENYRKHRVMGRMHRKHPKHGRGATYAAHRMNDRGYTGNMDKVKAILNYVVTRTSFNLPISLPIHLWNWLDYQAGFPQVFSTLPNGYTGSFSFTPITSSFPGSLVMTYWLTANPAITDSVTLTCLQTPYGTLLNSTITDKYHVGGGPPHQTGGTLQLSDPTQNALQFGNSLWKFTDRDPLGQDESYLIAPGTFFSSMQFQAAILDIKIMWGIDRQKGLLYNTNYVPGAAPGYVLSTTFNIIYDKVHMDSIQGHKPLGHNRHAQHAHHGRH